MSNADGGASPINDVDEGLGSASHVEHWQAEGSHDPRQRIAQLEEKLVALESGHAVKERQSNYYVAQGHTSSIEDLVAEMTGGMTLKKTLKLPSSKTFPGEDWLQVVYIMFMHTLQWFHKKAMELEYEEYAQMLKMVDFRDVINRLGFAELFVQLHQGADAARGDNTSKLKALVSEWVNREFKPDPLVDPDDKHSRGFSNDACGRLLCPLELDWNNPVVKAGIWDRTDGYIVTDLSFPAFVYEKYMAKPDDLEEGLFKGKILLQAYKAVFTSPSSAKDVEGDGDGADIIQNNRRAHKSFNAHKVKKHVAQIIKMEKVTPRSIAYIICQVSRSIDFFERPPGREAQRRVDRLLEWWTRKVFGRSHHDDISQTAKDNMSVNALARQRAAHDDAAFDSP
ncbi:hypothetical protein BD769DRAFT_1392712 [Suillus cothurnatus]|nr:hypothetical protein BD769DRAFT_1392712 [Suillus cothurnatus]